MAKYMEVATGISLEKWLEENPDATEVQKVHAHLSDRIQEIHRIIQPISGCTVPGRSPCTPGLNEDTVQPELFKRLEAIEKRLEFTQAKANELRLLGNHPQRTGRDVLSRGMTMKSMYPVDYLIGICDEGSLQILRNVSWPERRLDGSIIERDFTKHRNFLGDLKAALEAHKATGIIDVEMEFLEFVELRDCVRSVHPEWPQVEEGE